MKITKQVAADKLADYLHHAISLEELVEWAEAAMLEEIRGQTIAKFAEFRGQCTRLFPRRIIECTVP